MNKGCAAVSLVALLLSFSGCDNSPNGKTMPVVGRQSNPFIPHQERVAVARPVAPQMIASAQEPVQMSRPVMYQPAMQQIERKAPPPSYMTDTKWTPMADLFWWQANAGSLYDKSNVVFDLSGFADLSYSTIFDDLSYKWDPGFRVGLGRHFGGLDDWDCLFNFTYFYGTGKGKVDADLNFVFSSTTVDDVLEYNVPGKSSWGLNYYTFDFELGRNFFFKKKIQLRPMLGFRGAILNQLYHFTLEPSSLDLAATGESIDITFSAHSKVFNNYTGFGVRGGGRLVWELSPYLGLFGQFSGSAVVGEFDVGIVNNTVEDFSFFGGDTFESNGKAEDTYFRLRNNLEGLVGLYYKTPLCNNRHLLEITLGYETAVWFDQGEVDAFITSLSGLSVPSPLDLETFTPTNTLVDRDKHLGLRGVTLDMKYNF